jgi:hypothetical protein
MARKFNKLAEWIVPLAILVAPIILIAMVFYDTGRL